MKVEQASEAEKTVVLGAIHRGLKATTVGFGGCSR